MRRRGLVIVFEIECKNFRHDAAMSESKGGDVAVEDTKVDPIFFAKTGDSEGKAGKFARPRVSMGRQCWSRSRVLT